MNIEKAAARRRLSDSVYTYTQSPRRSAYYLRLVEEEPRSALRGGVSDQ